MYRGRQGKVEERLKRKKKRNGKGREREKEYGKVKEKISKIE